MSDIGRAMGRLRFALSHRQRDDRTGSAWRSPLVVALVSAGLTWILGQLAFRWNREEALHEKLVDRRLDVIEKVAVELAKYSRFRQGRIAYAAALAAEQQNTVPTLATKVEVEKALQSAMPHEYSLAVRTEESLPQLVAYMTEAQLYFGPRTRNSVGRLHAVIAQSPDQLIREYAKANPDSLAIIESGERVNVTTAQLVGFGTHLFDRAAEELLTSMREELSIESHLWRKTAGRPRDR